MGMALQMKPKFEPSELKAFDRLYHWLVEGNGDKDLNLFFKWEGFKKHHLNITQPLSFNVIALEIQQRTELGRALLDRIKEMRLI